MGSRRPSSGSTWGATRRTILDKKESCEHFAGEESYNEERRREIKKALQGCEKLEPQRKALLQKYRRDERVQRALAAEP